MDMGLWTLEQEPVWSVVVVVLLMLLLFTAIMTVSGQTKRPTHRAHCAVTD